MNKMKIKIFTLLSLLITFSLTLSSCDSLWDDLNTLPTYTITYVSDKGTAPETKTVEQGYKLTAEDLPTLTETGYNFKGWDKVVGDEITSDTTITASWIKTWTITYNSNNGTGTMEPQIFEENVPQALSENKFTREGYTFAGWATAADASEAGYADKASFTATKDITLYAIWSLIPPTKYTITYNSNSGSGTMEPQIFEENVPQALSENKFTREGYTFAGWATAADASTADYADKANYTATKDITLYAIWSVIPPAPVPSTYTITYNSNNGTGTMEPQIFEENVPQALSENKFTREGYTFAGWATKADASTAEYADKANYTATKDITLYAIWTLIPPARFTITYASTYGSKPANKEVDKGYKLTAEDFPTLTETGYRFINWDKAIDDEITSDTTITASWIKTWTISYASNKSELNNKLPTSKTVDEGYKLTADDLTALTADYYNFKGWDKSAGLEIKADVKITATWKKLFTISYSLPTGYSKDPKTVEEGYELVAADLPNIETDTQYGEWDKTVGTEITANTTITATWDDIVYLKNFKGIWELITFKSNFEKTVFTEDTYTGDTTNTIDCADDATNPGYFTGVISSDNKVFTIYGNGHRIYAPVNSSQLFSGFNKLSSIEFNNFYTSNVTNMMGMFAGTKLTSLDVSKFDTSKVTDMTGMFETCEDITSLDLSSFDTSSVTNMTKMFKECKELTTLNVSSFDTSKVTDMSSMFDQCEKLVSLNLSKFKTSEVTTMGSMFYNCKELTSLDVSKFDTSSVSYMKSMFEGCAKLTELDISSFDFSSMPDGKSFSDAGNDVFKNCSSLVTIYATNNFKDSMFPVFEGCSKLVGGNGTTCDGTTNISGTYARIDTDATPGYFTLKQ